jgi:hypothetical protein
MSHDPQELVKIFAGPLVEVELRHDALSDAGIESKVVGTNLTASFGSALTDSIELWIHRGDLAKAEDLLLKHAKPHHDHEKFPHPTDSPKAAPPHTHKEAWINPDPRS